jgi:superfamily II DNA/RNA helicase
MRKKNMQVEAISSDLEQTEREKVLQGFRSKRTRILVATDVLSRGIDIKEINLIINYDVPQDAEDYVHRVGRTARADATGVALTLVNNKDMYSFHQIEQLIEKEVIKLPLPPEIGKGPEWEKPGTRKKGGKKKKFKRSRNKKRDFKNKPGKKRKKD